MKKVIMSALAIIGLLTTVTAQPLAVRESPEIQVTRNGNKAIISPRVMTNTDTLMKASRCLYDYDLMFDFTVTRNSGNLLGYVQLLGTNDSVNGPWYQVTGSITACAQCTQNTWTLTNAATQTATIHVPKSPFLYYGMNTVTNGTCTATPQMKMRYKY